MTTKVSRNLTATLFSHLLRYGAPLIAYPILTRSLGTGGFAQFSLMLATALILSQFVEFGFGLMGVRGIAQGTPEQSKKAASEILLGRLVTMLLTSALFLAIVPWVPIDELRNPAAVAASLLLASAYGFSSSWYFIAVEKTPSLALQEVVCALATLVLIALFVRDANDAILAMACFWAPLWIAVIYGHVRAAIHLGFRPLTLRELVDAFARSTSFFVLTGVSSIINRSSVVFLGALSSPAQVAYYAAGEKLLTAAVNATLPFVRVLVPRISALVVDAPLSAKRLFRNSLIAITGAFTVAAAVAAAISPWAVPWFFGQEMGGAAAIVAVQMAIIPPTVANRISGMLGLIPLRQERVYQRMTLLAGAASLAALPLAAGLGGGMGVALARVAAELLLAYFCAHALWRLRAEWNNQTHLSRSNSAQKVRAPGE